MLGVTDPTEPVSDVKYPATAGIHNEHLRINWALVRILIMYEEPEKTQICYCWAR